MKLVKTDTLKSKTVHHTGHLRRLTVKSPDELLGVLFSDVQAQQVFPDGKTFADLIPKKRARAIFEEYKIAQTDPSFDMREFVSRHFYDLSQKDVPKEPLPKIIGETVSERITRLWDALERRNLKNYGSLLAVPYPYVVPGGRFTELFYWDSYFIMLGLAADGQWDRVESIVKNIAYTIRTYGYMPSANRSYLLSRSQPPVFSLMVELLATHKGARTYRRFLPQLLQEYRWWMRGVRKLKQTEHNAYRRVVQLPLGHIANRYYDNKNTPRPESHKEDTSTSLKATHRDPERLYLHVRAAAESGWDFSSRWLEDGSSLESIYTADILPVDLNCLLLKLEQAIARGFGLRNPLKRRTFIKRAEQRAQTIDDYFWNETERFYVDYNFHTHRQSKRLSMAAVLPLYTQVASSEQAAGVAARLEKDFLKNGGFVTTLVETGQQWDAPNGWAPLQWFAVEGLRNYGYVQLADEVQKRFMNRVETVFHDTGRIIEKYDVVGDGGLGGGGEYPLQDGFGWTNGVYQAFKKSFRP